MRIIGKISSTLVLLLSPILFHAQCAMCKAVVESEINSGTMTPEGINDGILYLMAVPYILVGTGIYLVYKDNKRMSEAA